MYLDQQARLFFWYRNRSRKDYNVQGWKPRRIYADFIVTLRDDQPGGGDGFRRVFVVGTKGVHLKESEDTEYNRSVFDICGEHARKTDWARVPPGDAEQGRALRGSGRGRVAGAAERNAVRRCGVRKPGDRPNAKDRRIRFQPDPV